MKRTRILDPYKNELKCPSLKIFFSSNTPSFFIQKKVKVPGQDFAQLNHNTLSFYFGDCRFYFFFFFPTDFDDVLGLKQGAGSSHEMKDITAKDTYLED